jgi:hypothetical protein
MSEITMLKVAEKQLQAMSSFVEVVQTHSLDSQDFKASYDTIITSLAFDPAVNLQIPQHIVYARHAIDIRATDSYDRYMHLISSDSLKNQGVAQGAVEAEQVV